MGELGSDRTWAFDAPVEQVWSALTRTGRFGTWWPWLRHLDAADGVVPGAVWRCAVKPPLPYTLRFTLAIDDVVPLREVRASLRGDLAGTAHLDLVATGDAASRLRLRSDLRPTRPDVAVVGLLAGPVLRWGHDWVLATGVRQFATGAGLPAPRPTVLH